MTIAIAINGYGRIGPDVPCAFMKAVRVHDIEIVAINDLGDAETNARLMRYDTAITLDKITDLYAAGKLSPLVH